CRVINESIPEGGERHIPFAPILSVIDFAPERPFIAGVSRCKLRPSAAALIESIVVANLGRALVPAVGRHVPSRMHCAYEVYQLAGRRLIRNTDEIPVHIG